MTWWARLAILAAAFAAGWQVATWRNDAAYAARLAGELSRVGKEHEEALARQREASAADRASAAKAAGALEVVREEFERLRALPPVALTQEVPGEDGCSRARLSDAFGLRFDEAAANPAPP